MNEQVEARCDKCRFGKFASKGYFGEGSIICKRFPQELRKDGDNWCGEFACIPKAVIDKKTKKGD